MRIFAMPLLLACLLLAGCTGSRGAEDKSEDTAGSRAEAQTLRIGVNGLPSSLANPFRGNGRPGIFVWSQLFDALTRLDEEGALVPALALSWEAEDATHWRLRLRPGVRFSNGQRFDAPGAAKVLNWLASPEGRRTVVGAELKAIERAWAAGPLDLRIATSEPDPILPKRLVSAWMVEPDLWRELGAEGFAQAPVGTGPFRLLRWDHRQRRVELVASRQSWRSTGWKRLSFIELPDAAVRTQALLSRDVDIAPVEIEEIDRLEERGYPVSVTGSMAVMSIAFRTEGDAASPLRDVRVRRALNLAVDKEALARLLLRGMGRLAGQPAARGVSGQDPAIAPYPYDPRRARELLAQAGHAQGFDLDIDILTNSLPADSLIYQAVAWQLGEVGVRAHLRVTSLPEYLRKLATNGWSAGAFGASWNAAPYNDAIRSMESFSCLRANPFFCDRALADRLVTAQRIGDDARREQALRAVGRGFHEAAPALFLVEQIDLFSYQKDLHNVTIANRIPAFETITRAAEARR
ncbi:hypothetical protein I5E68_16065 [Novosphingobium sp. YJ-S2-02]|uniref:Solute-binding protein family 5 domain-containing protein n=1 Tax=Novosphingobium aureum TaxID=2792964 RepID=A0A931HE56_9SPHN|nr:ABC transporter substrate-binding protein [Novosphingobium aureum]MBH0114462.1 hypothetical protein [Novosphingobium aureum]